MEVAAYETSQISDIVAVNNLEGTLDNATTGYGEVLEKAVRTALQSPLLEEFPSLQNKVETAIELLLKVLIESNDVRRVLGMLPALQEFGVENSKRLEVED